MDVEKAFQRPQVFFEIAIDNVIAGNIIAELFSDITPKTCENFLALCTGFIKYLPNGENLNNFQYKNTCINKILHDKYIECGDLNKAGEEKNAILGQYFEDENFICKHEKAGILSMSNEGFPNSNSSKFIITTNALPELDGRNVVFGHVIKGMGIIKQIENLEIHGDDNTIVKMCVINDCGIYDPSCLDTACHVMDGVRDWYADWPEDQPDLDPKDVQDVMNIATHIKHFGKLLFKRGNYALANQKYIKALRYLNALAENHHSMRIEENGAIMNLITTCILNSAACKIKMQRYEEAIHDCDEALDMHPLNPKALFRRAQANHGKHRYEDSLKDLHMALELKPHDKAMMAELIAIKGEMQVYKINSS